MLARIKFLNTDKLLPVYEDYDNKYIFLNDGTITIKYKDAKIIFSNNYYTSVFDLENEKILINNDILDIKIIKKELSESLIYIEYIVNGDKQYFYYKEEA